MLSLKIVALIEITQLGLSLLFLSYINAHAISRFGALLCVDCLDYVQDADKSKIKPIAKQTLSSKDRLVSFLIICPFCVVLLFHSPILILICIPLTVVFSLAVNYFKKRIGGYTGDCLGALQQLLEVVFYLSVIAIV